MPKITGKAKRIRVYIGESDRWKGRSLFESIVLKAKELDMAGATVCRGLMGYGANSRIHTYAIAPNEKSMIIISYQLQFLYLQNPCSVRFYNSY